MGRRVPARDARQAHLFGLAVLAVLLMRALGAKMDAHAAQWPALAIGVSALGSSLPIPRVVRVAYLIAAAAAFAYYFPFRGLP